MDQPLLAAAPLPVAARARIDARAEAVVDRPWGLGGRRNGRGTFLRRRSRSKEDVAVGGAEGWVVVGVGDLRCGGVVAPAEQFPSPAGGAAGKKGAASGERGEGEPTRVADAGAGEVVAGAGVERGEGRSWGPGEGVREGAISSNMLRTLQLSAFLKLLSTLQHCIICSKG
jgi:hypothetical protein